MNKTREQILADEFVRPALPGLRIFSTGLLIIARKLRLSFALPKAEREQGAVFDPAREEIAACWLLDLRNDLGAIREAGEMGPSVFAEQILTDYEFNLSPALFALATAELSKTTAAMEAVDYVVHPRPLAGGDKHEQPPGK